MRSIHKKPHANNSMDGFVSRPTGNSPIGFNLPTPQTVKPQKDTFPGVGMTLSTYTPNGNQATQSGVGFRPQGSTGSLKSKNDAADQPPIKKKKHRRWKRVLIVIIVLVLLPTGWLGYKFWHNASKVFHGNVLSVLRVSKLKGEDTGRVNILLAGNSADDPGHQGGQLTDSIMIISIDTRNNTAFLLSVPRDLWVDIGDSGHAKINEAYVDGESSNFNESGYFPGGMGQLQQVIQQNFNINLDYYALVNYNAFRDMVNAVGGINITIQSTDKRGLYDPSVDYVTHGPLVKLTNGVHTLTGEQALDLARARGDAYGSYGFPQSDFDRTTHQRQELLALRAKATSTGVLANPVKISSLLDAAGNNIKTDFTLGEVRRLIAITKPISSAKVQSMSLNNANNKNLLANYTSGSGESALDPAAGLDDFDDIQEYIKQLTSNDPVVREGASVVVLNATDTSGLAASAMKTLTNKGLTSNGVDDASANQATTTIVDLSAGAKPATKALLTKLYGTNVTTTNPYPNYQADFIVIVGADKVPKTTTSPPATTGSQ